MHLTCERDSQIILHKPLAVTTSEDCGEHESGLGTEVVHVACDDRRELLDKSMGLSVTC